MRTAKHTAELQSSRRLPALLREVALIAWLAALVYLAVALLTYSPSDPGPMHSGVDGEVINRAGPVGAYLADLLFSAFGQSAIWLAGLLGVLGWRIRQAHFESIESRSVLWACGGFVLATLGVCGLEQMYFPLGERHPFYAGGILGRFIAQPLSAEFGAIGATLIFLVAFIGGVTLTAQFSWLHLMDVIGYRAFGLVAWVRAQFEKQSDRRRGAGVRKQRRMQMRQLREKLHRTPPKIAVRASTARQGERPHKERQVNLFETGAADLPPLSLLESPTAAPDGYSRDELETMSRLLVKKLKDFNVEVTVDAVQPGPVITRFEINPAPGVRAGQIVALARDLARSLSVESVRVVDNIAGKSVIGVEIPNQSREVVRLVEGLSSQAYEKTASPLSMVLGKDIAGNPVISDLQKMPHVLIAGTTGSGKSVCINALILSIVYKASPEQVRLLMVDPKFLELSGYDGVPHLLTPVVTDMNKAAQSLRWCIGEMDRRFRLMAALGVRNINGYNKRIYQAGEAGEPLLDPLADESREAETLCTLPYIVVIVDELADLMMSVGKKIEEIIIRIAQRARAAGIHLVLATQRPSVDVVTGLIKANVPTRIAFQVSSRADSRTVLDQMGAEQLLGQGDMLYQPPGGAPMVRVHGSFVSDEEVAGVVAHLKQQGAPNYLHEVTEGAPDADASSGESAESDPLYDQAVKFVTQSRRASISSLQRALRVGYNRAARMIETMEQSGVVSPSENGKREVLAAQPPVD